MCGLSIGTDSRTTVGKAARHPGALLRESGSAQLPRGATRALIGFEPADAVSIERRVGWRKLAHNRQWARSPVRGIRRPVSGSTTQSQGGRVWVGPVYTRSTRPCRRRGRRAGTGHSPRTVALGASRPEVPRGGPDDGFPDKADRMAPLVLCVWGSVPMQPSRDGDPSSGRSLPAHRRTSRPWRSARSLRRRGRSRGSRASVRP